MKKHFTKILITVCLIALSVYFLWPTLKDYNYRKQLSQLSGQDSIDFVDKNRDKILDAKMKRLKLGLDLQGGMRVVLEVDVIQLLSDLAKNKDDNFNKILSELRNEATSNEISLIKVFADKFRNRNIRLSRYYGSIRDSDDRIEEMLESEAEKAVDRAKEIVNNRVNQYGVSEPTIQKQGSQRIIVELPGVKDENEVRMLLNQTAKLEFRLLKDPQISYRVMESIDKFLTGKSTEDTIKVKRETEVQKEKVEKRRDALTELMGGTTISETDTTAEAKFTREHPFFRYVRPDQRGSGEAYVLESDKEKVSRLLNRPEVQQLIPSDFEFLWSAKPIEFLDNKTNEKKKFYILYPVKRTAELTGAVITNANATIDPEDNRPIVNMEMNSEGSKEWARITGANIQKRIAIIMDNSIFSAPVVQTKITGGRSRITGMDSPDEARLLEIVLKAGALPAPVSIIEQRSVGPSLGEDSIQSGLNSTIIALIFIALFLIIYYSTGGSVAEFALLFNILFILGVLAAFQATLTLPGIAGIVLTIGLAVDANVLINERIREELEGGKTLKAAIDAGYSKAFTAIFDSNLTTFITGIILYQFGTGPVQGFALTLMIGIFASLFSAIVITHLIFNILTDKGINPKFG